MDNIATHEHMYIPSECYLLNFVTVYVHVHTISCSDILSVEFPFVCCVPPSCFSTDFSVYKCILANLM